MASHLWLGMFFFCFNKLNTGHPIDQRNEIKYIITFNKVHLLENYLGSSCIKLISKGQSKKVCYFIYIYIDYVGSL